MNDFLTGLFNGLMQELQLPTEDPGHEQAIQGYLELEAQVKEKLGPTLFAGTISLCSPAVCGLEPSSRWRWFPLNPPRPPPRSAGGPP